MTCTCGVIAPFDLGAHAPDCALVEYVSRPATPWCDRGGCTYEGLHHHLGDALPAGKAYVLVETFPEGSYARVERGPDPEFAAELAGYATLKPTGPDTLAVPQ